jgi:NAD-dependent DNA ligase
MKIEIPAQYQKYFPTTWNGHSVSFDGVQLMVDNFESTDEFQSLKLHNSIVSIGIEGIGPATASKLQKAGQTLISLLSINPIGLRTELLKSDQFKDGRELENLIENVFALTKVELWSVIYSMGFKNCGKTVSKQLANWKAGISYDFKGLEKQVVEEFISSLYVQDELNDLIDILSRNNVEVVYPQALKAGLITFEMTGSPTTHSTKSEFKREVESSGNALHITLSKDTMYLICETTSLQTSKMLKATKNGTKIITYDDFLIMINSL